MNCDAIARWYRWMEYAACGRALERRRCEYLGEVADAHCVLILGDGDGRFTADFLKRNRTALVDSIDASVEMQRLSKRRIGSESPRIRLVTADAREVELAGNYDLIVTHFFLDCFSTEDVTRLIERVSDAAAVNPRWLISEFREPDGRWRRAFGRGVIYTLYVIFGLLTGLSVRRLPDYAPTLAAAGFLRTQARTAAGGLLISELWTRQASG